jgi:hypothetical protein
MRYRVLLTPEEALEHATASNEFAPIFHRMFREAFHPLAESASESKVSGS